MQKGGKRIGERGLAWQRTTYSSQSMLGFTLISTEWVDQLFKEPHFFTGSMLALLSSKSNNFSFRHGQHAATAWHGHGTCTSAWYKHFLLLFCCVSGILQLTWFYLDLYTLWSSWCTWVLIQNWIQIYRIVPIGSGRLWLRRLLSFYRSYPLPSLGLQNRSHFVMMQDNAVQCTNKIHSEYLVFWANHRGW